jgi:ABC-type dipeptide/oligopeptide/nickel transport system permease component
LFIVSLLAFLAFQIIPGEPATKMLGTQASPEKLSELRSQLGPDRPVFERYFEWLLAFVKGDFGNSYSYRMSVADMLSDKLPVTVLLTIMSFLITAFISIPLGIITGCVENSFLDQVFLLADQIFMSVPSFFLGVISCYLFGITLHFFTPGAFIMPSEDLVRSLNCLIFPALSLALPRIAMTVRMLRGSVRKELTANYIYTARIRGLSYAGIIRRHVLKNAMLPVITFLAVSAAEIMTGTIIIEQVFTIPGIGRLLISSIGSRDFPVVQAIVVLLAAWIVIVNFAADIINQIIDPRRRQA